MRRPWLMAAVAWPVALVLYSLSAVVVIANKHQDKVKLKVDIRKETLVGAPSCQHTFTQIELLNLHPTEPIMIHSIQTTPEETVLIKSESGTSDGRKWEDHSIPQQIHISKLPSGSVSLGPGQVAIVPVTFLPRFPNLEEDREEEHKRKLRNNRDDEGDEGCPNGKPVGDNYTMKKADDGDDDDGQSPPPITVTALYDLVDMVGDKRILHTMDSKRLLTHTLDPSYRRRNNLEASSLPEIGEFQVTTTVVVDTSRGVVKLPVTATSVRDNLYQIPDTIQFHHPNFESGDTSACIRASSRSSETTADASAVDLSTIKSRKTLASLYAMDRVVILDTVHASDQLVANDGTSNPSAASKLRMERECFDLYLSNPMADRELQIVEALISKPDLLSIKFDPGRVTGVPDSNLLVGSGASQAIRQWSQEGPLYLPPDSDDNYVLTLCTAFSGEVEHDQGSETYLDEMTKWIDTGSQDRNLGFLQIRTDGETLFIGLEHSDDIPYLSLKKSSDGHAELATNVGGGDATSSPPAIPSSPSDIGSRGSSTSLLKSFPEHLEFGIMSSSGPPRHFDIGVQNKSPVPIRIMRVTTALHASDELLPKSEIEALGLQVNVTFPSDGLDDSRTPQLDSLILGPAASLHHALTLSLLVDPERFHLGAKKDVYALNGTVIIRGTIDTNLSYNEWLEATVQNPYRDQHLTIEIPFSLSILNGRIEAVVEVSSHPYPELFYFEPWDLPGSAVSHLYFPRNAYTALPNLEDHTPQQVFLGSNEIRHEIRILSNNAVPLSLEHASIVGYDQHNAEARSLCQRFNISVTKNFEDTGRYQGYEELGLLVLKYKFGKTRKSPMISEENSRTPVRCVLEVSTSPVEAGSFNMPLLIFPGHVEVTTNSPELEAASSTAIASRAFSGFSNLLNWCKSSTIGMAFLDLLRTKSEDRKGSKKDSTHLSNYVKGVSGTSHLPISSPKFLPILLQLGAVDHGEVAKGSFYLTNRNPIPISVSIDVGELEGSEISLSREGSLAGGDGNCVWDYLPGLGIADIVEKGGFVGHPVDGILEFFFTNQEAQDFLSGFSFRDSISPHYPSLEGSDYLWTLYDFHSTATFHRMPIDEASGTLNASHCTGIARPPEYNFDQQHQKQGNDERAGPASVPLIMTSDRKLVKPLESCYEGGPSSFMNIDIPPGAMARFLVQIRAPPKTYLENDISQLLGTGLVLSTSVGDVMPIFAAFEALQGQLQAANSLVSPDSESAFEFGPSMRRYSNVSIINVPVEFTWTAEDYLSHNEWNESVSVNIPPMHEPTQSALDTVSLIVAESNREKKGIPLFLKSSFTRNMRLIRLESCNPWFNVIPAGAQSYGRGGNDGVLVGFLNSKVDCSAPNSTLNVVPSYFQCLYNWLLNRLSVQPEGCGLGLLSDAGIDLRRIENIKIALRHGLHHWPNFYQANATWKGLTVDFEPNEMSTNLFHAKTGRPRDQGVLVDREFYATLLKAIEVSNKYGYNWLSTSLIATVEYDPTSPDSLEVAGNVNQKQNLTLSIGDLAIRTILAPPRLFHSKDSAHPTHQFISTPVGGVSESYIPLYNPTSVPVTVRLRVPNTPTTTSHSNDNNQVLFGHSPGYLIPAPYVQNGDHLFLWNNTSHHSWWEGDGAFFMLDPHGDMIRSRHNITIKAGAGAIVSLVNPSLHAQVGMLAGCGRRCGIRDENPQVTDFNVAYSPVGASAAAGTTLTGRVRNISPQANVGNDPKPNLLAGGISVPGTGGPAAFAIPYSSLDEIVIPPYGRGRIGPIYFRPPGLFKGVGCGVANKSGSKLSGLENHLCKSNTFESLLHLDNSMSGLEHVILQGRSLLDRVIFVDPLSTGDDVFANIENRNGRPTIIFRGTNNFTVNSGRLVPIVQEAVIYNDGDAVVDIAFVGIDAKHDGRSPSLSCHSGNFRLRDCLLQSDDENIALSLKPGQSRSVFVEYLQDCSKRVELASLVVEFLDRPLVSFSTSTDDMFQSRFNRNEYPFHARKIRLQLSYEMDDAAFSTCAQAGTNAPGGSANVSLVSYVFLLFSSVLLLCFALRARFYAMWGMLRKVPTYLAYDRSKEVSSQKSRSHWNAAFRCLARADPSSPELQGLGREQMRQIVSGLYKAKGVAPPVSLQGSNAFARERRTLTVDSARKRIGKESMSGNDRIRTLSDAIFQDTDVSDTSSLRHHLPAGIGWRTAFSRGILKEDSTNLIRVCLNAYVLEKKRDVPSRSFESQDFDDDHNAINPVQKGSRANDPKEKEDATDMSSTNETRRDDIRTVEGRLLDSEMGEALSVVSTSDSEGAIPAKPVNQATADETTKGKILEDGSDATDLKGSNGSKNSNATSSIDDDTTELLRKGNSERSRGPRGTYSNKNTEKGSRKKEVRTKDQKKKEKPQRESESSLVVNDNSGRSSKMTGHRTEKLLGNMLDNDSMAENGKLSQSGKNNLSEAPSACEEQEDRLNGIASSSVSVGLTVNSVRPPPGLAPPPGFGGSPSSTLENTDQSIKIDVSIDNIATLESLLDAALTEQAGAELQAELASSPAQLPFSPSSVSDSVFFSGNRDGVTPQPPIIGGSENHFSFAPPARTSTVLLESDPVARDLGVSLDAVGNSPPTLLNESSQNGFDVMDFLDSILNEGGPLEDPEGAIVPNSLLGSAGNSTPVLANPWASENRSRASAYGISFDEDDDSISNDSTNSRRADGDADDPQPTAASIPLLTSAAILNATENVEQDANAASDPISFLSELVND